MMRPLDLNLASRPFRNNTLVWLAYAGLLAAAVWLTYWNVSSFIHYRAELTELDQIQGNMEQEQRDLTARHKSVLQGVKRFDRVSIGRRASKANQVIEWKAFSWTRLFNRLEEVLPHNIKLTSVKPVFRNRERDPDDPDPRRSMPVAVEGVARDFDAVFELQSSLFQHAAFGAVKPRQIDKLDNGELAFSIEFRYYPDERDGSETVAVEASDVAADAGAPAPAGGEELEPPPAAPRVGEVTDEWAERGEPEEPAKPQRRALPQVQPDPDGSDDEDESR